jgi:hypothetical protein
MICTAFNEILGRYNSVYCLLKLIDELFILGCNIMHIGESLQTLSRNTSHSSYGHNNKPSKKLARTGTQAEFLDMMMVAISCLEISVEF